MNECVWKKLVWEKWILPHNNTWFIRTSQVAVFLYLLSEWALPLSERGLPAPDIPLPPGLPASEWCPLSSSSSSSSRWPRSEPLCCSASEWSFSPWSECTLASDWFPDRSDWLSLPLCWLCCSSSLSSPNNSYEWVGDVIMYEVRVILGLYKNLTAVFRT